MNKTFSVEQPTFEVQKSKTLSVVQKFHLDFSDCRTDAYPKNKADFKAIIDLLSTISNSSSEKDLKKSGWHPLSNKGNGKHSNFISSKIKEFNKVYSLDVQHRGGSNGKWRLLLYVDFDDARLLHVLDCFIDDHD